MYRPIFSLRRSLVWMVKLPFRPCDAAYLIDRSDANGSQICGYGFCIGWGRTDSCLSVVPPWMTSGPFSPGAGGTSLKTSSARPWSWKYSIVCEWFHFTHDGGIEKN